MSQKASRKSAVNEEKEKSSDIPVKEMKKKIAANAEKEKQAAEKITEKPAEKPEKTDKNPEKIDKSAEKTEKSDKSTEKLDKSAEKSDKTDKKTEKADKKQDKPVEKKVDPQSEKKEEKDNSKDDKSGKPEKPDPKKAEPKPKQNGKSSMNGTHGTEENGTVSAVDDFEEDDELVIDDEHFPELTYDDTSDPEFEPPTPEASSRSFTRRSQAKATRTPETPRPASDKQTENADDQSKDKVLKLKEDVPSTDRKLRSADSPKPQESKKTQEKPQESAKRALESPKKQDGKQESETKDQEEKENGAKTEKVEMDVVIEIDGDDEPRKPDTNYSKSRVKVSPYRRSIRPADQTASSIMANYTGNNTTMEMDISETSSFVSHGDASLDDSSYLSGLRSIRGRRSYKPLKEMTLRHVAANRSAAKSATTTPASEAPPRPTGTVVGRKRKPDADDVEPASEASELISSAHSKRTRLLDRLAHSLRRTASSTPLPARRAAEIVGINTDLPLTAPVAAPDTFDPESLKAAPPLPPTAVSPDARLGPASAAPVPLAPPDADKDSKRCVVM